MKTLYKRLLTFFIGLPIVFGFVFINIYNHLPLHFLMLFFAVAGAIEFCRMANNKVQIFPTWLIVTDVVILWATCLAICLFSEKFPFLSFELILWVFSAEIIILFGIESFTAKTFETSIIKIALSTLIIFYIGFLTTFITRISTLPNETLLLVLYFIFVFLCDSSAWFFGVLFGKSSRGVIAASPNKSVVGFIGGIVGSVVCGYIFTLFFPEVFNMAFWKILLTGFFTAIASIIGDLVESVFKRSCEVKDSGKIIPGRGGSMDCLDSLILAAPVFYACAISLLK